MKRKSTRSKRTRWKTRKILGVDSSHVFLNHPLKRNRVVVVDIVVAWPKKSQYDLNEISHVIEFPALLASLTFTSRLREIVFPPFETFAETHTQNDSYMGRSDSVTLDFTFDTYVSDNIRRNSQFDIKTERRSRWDVDCSFSPDRILPPVSHYLFLRRSLDIEKRIPQSPSRN